MADSFIRYPWACPNPEAEEEARKAFLALDEEAFEDTGCSSLRPETEYRILRCDQDLRDKYLEKFDYPIERTDELTSLRCEISITTDEGHNENLFLEFGELIELEP